MTMPAHADVVEGLQKKAAGFRMVTLTNSPPNPKGQSPLEHADLHPSSRGSSASKQCVLISPLHSSITWSHKSWMFLRLPAAWWRPTSGTQSEPKARVFRQRWSRAPEMSFCLWRGCLSPTSLRRIFQR
jgi:hypothetical protein